MPLSRGFYKTWLCARAYNRSSTSRITPGIEEVPMLKSWMAPAAAALAVLLLAGSVDSAAAHKGGGGGWSGGGGKFSGGGGKFYGGKVYSGGGKVYSGGTKFYGGKVYYGNQHARFRHRHRFVGVPLAGYGYYAYS